MMKIQVLSIKYKYDHLFCIYCLVFLFNAPFNNISTLSWENGRTSRCYYCEITFIRGVPIFMFFIHYCCKDLQPIPPPTNMHCSHSTVAFERLLKLTSSTYLWHEMSTNKRKCVLWFLVVSVKHTISLPTKNMKIGTPRIKVISQQ
jgi:hypothetical protein